jgi:hypothetical protein
VPVPTSDDELFPQGGAGSKQPATGSEQPMTGSETTTEPLLAVLATELRSAQTVWGSLNSMCVIVATTLPDLSCCSVTARGPQGARTVAASAYLARVLDVFQYRWDEGPCADAMRTGETSISRAVREERRWPWWVRQAREAGVGAVVSVPVTVGSRVLGTLNLYSNTGGMSDGTVAAGPALAAAVRVLLAPAVPYGTGEPAVIAPPLVSDAIAAARAVDRQAA